MLLGRWRARVDRCGAKGERRLGEAGWRRAQGPPEREGIFGNTRRWASSQVTGRTCSPTQTGPVTCLSDFQGGGCRRPWLQPGGV